MADVAVSQVPISGGENTSADPATQATSLVANTTIGPAGENAPRAALVDTGTTGLSGPVNGSYAWRDWVIHVTQDRKIWAVAQGAPTTAIALSDATAATQLAGTARPVFAEDGLPRVVIAGGNAIQQWQGGGLTSVLVTAGYSPSATHVAYLGQRLIANDRANPTLWYWSDLGDGAHQSWTATNFTTADASPDTVVGVYANIREAYVFGQRTVQVYAVGQDPLNPFDNIVTLAVGCAAPYSPVDADGQWIWLDDKRRIVISDGRQFQDISMDIALTLRRMNTVVDCWSYREDISYDTYYVFKFPTEKREFIYDTDRKAWMERLYSAGDGTLPIQSHTFWPIYNVHLFGSSTTGAVYKYDLDQTKDLGNPIVMERVTGHLDHGTQNRKRSVRVRCTLRRGTGGASGVSDKLEVRVADDGGPWSDWEFIDIGLSGDTTEVVDAYLGGVFRRRRYHFRYSGAQDTALLTAEEHFVGLES